MPYWVQIPLHSAVTNPTSQYNAMFKILSVVTEDRSWELCQWAGKPTLTELLQCPQLIVAAWDAGLLSAAAEFSRINTAERAAQGWTHLSPNRRTNWKSIAKSLCLIWKHIGTADVHRSHSTPQTNLSKNKGTIYFLLYSQRHCITTGEIV